jgi:glycolate oxidase FAD binding subunit
MLDQLRSIAGADALLSETETSAWSIADVTPRAVLMPHTVEEVVAVVSEAARMGVPIESAGGGGWLQRGPRPKQPPIVVSVARLNRVLEYEPADLTISAEAGATLSKLRELTGDNRQMVANDAPAAHTATVGAMVSTGASGPLRHGYGTPRDQVIGLQIVAGDGRVLNLGGKVVKNVAGYDLTRLLIGSHGTLGIITRVNLKLRPLPDQDATFLMTGRTEELIRRLPGISAAALELVAIELLPNQGDSSNGSLLLRVHGNVATVDAAIVELKRVAQPLQFAQLETAEAESQWHALLDTSLTARFGARLAALPDQAGVLLQLAARLRPHFAQSQVVLHAANGIARVYAHGPIDDPRALSEEIARITVELDQMRGSVALPVIPSELQEHYRARAPAAGEARLMRELKRVFDPAGILAPHRFGAA